MTGVSCHIWSSCCNILRASGGSSELSQTPNGALRLNPAGDFEIRRSPRHPASAPPKPKSWIHPWSVCSQNAYIKRDFLNKKKWSYGLNWPSRKSYMGFSTNTVFDHKNSSGGDPPSWKSWWHGTQQIWNSMTARWPNMTIFIARQQHTDTRYWYSNYVCLSVCPSVRLSVTFRY